MKKTMRSPRPSGFFGSPGTGPRNAGSPTESDANRAPRLLEDKRGLIRASGDDARAADPEHDCRTESAVMFVSRILAQSIGFNAAELTKLTSLQPR